jgi:predicted nucleotidyltransferase
MSIEKLEDELEEKQHVKENNKKDILDKRDIAAKVVKFTNEARRHYGELIKSVLIFGSAVRGELKKGSDIDVWVVLDDTATKSSEDLSRVTEHLYILSQELKDLHIQVHTLTEFWQSIRLGSPEFVNFLRYGLVIHDTGFIKPIQRMLTMGLLPPSDEVVTLKAKAAETRYKKIRLDIKSMIFELRYSATDIIQAVVMYFYKKQPDQKGIPEYLEKMVKAKKLEREYIQKFNDLNKLWKDIDHKIIKEVTTDHLDKALVLTKSILDRFKKMLPDDIIGEELPQIE